MKVFQGTKQNGIEADDTTFGPLSGCHYSTYRFVDSEYVYKEEAGESEVLYPWSTDLDSATVLHFDYFSTVAAITALHVVLNKMLSSAQGTRQSNIGTGGRVHDILRSPNMVTGHATKPTGIE